MESHIRFCYLGKGDTRQWLEEYVGLSDEYFKKHICVLT